MTRPAPFEIDSRETAVCCDDPLLPGDLAVRTTAGLEHDRCPSDKESL